MLVHAPSRAALLPTSHQATSAHVAQPSTHLSLHRAYRHASVSVSVQSSNDRDGPSSSGVSTAPPQPEVPAASPSESPSEPSNSKRLKRQADSTDVVASFLTRRFGLAGGLAWLGFLAVGTLGEQIKTRLEVYSEEQGTKVVEDAPTVTLPSGVAYRDVVVGGGSPPIKGYLMVVDYVGKANGEVFEDTKARGKPIVFFYRGRPFTGGLCAGVEEAMAGMKAGGRRIITVPPSMGFGETGTVLRPTEHVKDKDGVIPGGAVLEYDLSLLRVSIPPS